MNYRMEKDHEELDSFGFPFPSRYGPANCCLLRLIGEGDTEKTLRGLTQFRGTPVEPAARIPAN